MKWRLLALILFGTPALTAGEAVVFNLRVTEFALGRPFYVFDVASTEKSNGIRKMQPGITGDWTVVFEGKTTPELIGRLYRQINRVDVFALDESYATTIFDGDEAVFEFTLGGKTKRVFVSNCYHEYFDQLCGVLNQMFPEEDRITFAPRKQETRISGIEMKEAEPAASDNPENAP